MKSILLPSSMILSLCLLQGCGTDVAAPGNDDRDDARVRTPATQPSAGTDLRQATLVLASDPVPHLADASGAALYYLEGDANGERCDQACEAVWPPVLGEGRLQDAGQAIEGGAIGSLDRGDGGRQVTWRGNPLYRYAGDLGAARTAGDDVQDEWGHWRLAQP